ncbi:MAG: dienelactone hydrolase family protein [Bdellovibrionota bacterium]
MSNSLKTTEIQGKNTSQAVVLLHGFGANRQDLVPLAEVMKLKSSPSWIFPDAPESPPDLALFGGRAWFPLDMSQIQRRAQDPYGALYDAGHVARLKKATDSVLSGFLWSLSERYSSIVLGGFSQGAMMALDWAWRHYDPSVKGLLLMSGAWPYLEIPADCRIPKDLPVFVSHGSQDPVLRFPHSEKMKKALEAQGAKVDTIVFPGGHEIPGQVLSRAQKFLDAVLES